MAKLLKKNRPSRLDPKTISNIDLLSDRKPSGNTFMNHDFPAKARELWVQHKDYVLENWPNPTTRPQTWWLFDAPEPPPFEVGRPGQWAKYPELVPSEAIQRLFLERHGLV